MHLHHSTTSPNHELNNRLVLANSRNTEEVFVSLKFNDGSGEVVMFDCPIKFPKFWGSCNGLLCLTSIYRDDANKVFLWNPLTKEFKDLPPPLPLTDIPIGITEVRSYWVGSITYGFGYDRFIDDYKIIRCEHSVGHLDGDEENYGDHIGFTEFQVYTLGTNTWRKISSDNNPFKSYFVSEIQKNRPTVFVNGALHWTMSKSSPRESESEWRIEFKMISFDIEKEVFRKIKTPFPELDINLKDYYINKPRLVAVGENDKHLYDSVIYMESLVPLNSGVYKGGRTKAKTKTKRATSIIR